VGIGRSSMMNLVSNAVLLVNVLPSSISFSGVPIALVIAYTIPYAQLPLTLVDLEPH